MAEVPKLQPTDSNEVSSSYVNSADKEVLAPSEGPRLPRDDVIKTAVKFLQNAKVRSSPLTQKNAFLEKKGLTPEEIRIAVEQSGVQEISTDYGSNSNSVVYPPPPPGMAMMPAAHPSFVPIPPQSRWAKLRDLTMTTVVVASVSYAVYQLFQVYLRPYILGKSAQDKRIEKLELQVEQIHRSVADSLGEIGQTLQAIQASINTQQAQQAIVNPVDNKAIGDLKSDISSLKGLLLGRNQFPPAPTTSPMLPLWQRTSPSPGTITANNVNTDQSASPHQDSSKIGTDSSHNDELVNKVKDIDTSEISFGGDSDSVDTSAIAATESAINQSNLDIQD